MPRRLVWSAINVYITRLEEDYVIDSVPISEIEEVTVSEQVGHADDLSEFMNSKSSPQYGLNGHRVYPDPRESGHDPPYAIWAELPNPTEADPLISEDCPKSQSRRPQHSVTATPMLQIRTKEDGVNAGP